ncbi:hypothetical protein [Brevundimonas sp. Root1423]|uniref:hypothetical protein n=1 Tax=Brevundimonas sp. Root1423 TaxID=1736462 RepID=UPI0006FE4409|nr:hypothetical protein [Brevundimonas sp. Root1423]KQY89831.1 hypothetical protein ASD25_04690 [Brevundimonas sp. Root1423]
MKTLFLRVLFGTALALAATPAIVASSASAQSIQSPLVAFIPPPPSGFENTMPPAVVEDLNGMEPSAHHSYGRSEPGAKGVLGITITHPSPADLQSWLEEDRPLGPHPMAPWMVTSRVKINDLDAYLSYNEQGPGGVLQMKVGRVLVGIQGSEVTPELIIAFARSMDTAALQKY